MLQGTQRHVSSVTMGDNEGCTVRIIQVYLSDSWATRPLIHG